MSNSALRDARGWTVWDVIETRKETERDRWKPAKVREYAAGARRREIRSIEKTVKCLYCNGGNGSQFRAAVRALPLNASVSLCFDHHHDFVPLPYTGKASARQIRSGRLFNT